MTSPSNPGALSLARRSLAAFAERQPPTQADIDQVMRALVSHDDWYVPALFADRAWGQTNFDQVLMFADAAPSPVLNVFTDHESALLADGQAIGVYGGPVSGQKLMRALDSNLSALIVNPASPREHQWYVSAAGFDVAVRWATAITVEQALARRGNGPVPVAELLAHRYLLLLERSTHGPARVELPDIAGSVVVCFTASDRAEEFLAGLPPTARPLAEVVDVTGPQLFETIRNAGASGLVVNAGSVEQTALAREDIAEVVGVRA